MKSRSIPERLNVLKACEGSSTIGSPFRLKEVFMMTGTPVISPKRSIIRW